MPKRVLLVDGDILVYRAASANQRDYAWDETTSSQVLDLDGAQAHLDEALNRLADRLKADQMIVCLSGGDNFRKKVYPLYKHNRKPGDKPLLMNPLHHHLEDHYEIKRMWGLEADDCLGILATRVSTDQRIVVSDDKDLRQIPGRLYVPRTGEKLVIPVLQANRWFYQQCITGDSTDGYPGAYRQGPKSRYVQAVNRRHSEGFMWATVLAAYRQSVLRFGHDRVADPLVQARCARILRASEWDFREKAMRLWEPPAN